MRAPVFACAFAAVGVAAAAAPDAPQPTSPDAPHGELHLRRTEPRAALVGPLRTADALAPSLVEPPAAQWSATAEVAATWRTKAAGLPLALGVRALAGADRPDGGPTASRALAEELHVAADLGAWQLSAGRKVVSWDVGFGLRPNDLVQQERRRTLVPEPLTGHPLVMAEVFSGESAWSLVRVNPNHAGDAALQARDDQEAAWAARAYRRFGAADAYLFARDGDRTGTSLGAAFAWVAGDALELHGSARRMQHHEGWATDPAASLAPVTSDPYRWQRDGAATQALVGLQWTGEAKQGVLCEAWFDGTAPSHAQWQQWRERNDAVAASVGPRVPAALAAGNLAWQARALDRSGLVRQNLFLRLSARPGANDAWELAFDTLYAPGDRGRLHTLGVSWQGDRAKAVLALRRSEGPAAAVFRQLPARTTAVLDAGWSF
ncbi:MAG: hypothetical protein U1F25_14490 [Rubrivivax sp.]